MEQPRVALEAPLGVQPDAPRLAVDVDHAPAHEGAGQVDAGGICARLLQQLAYSSFFKGVRGVVLGHFTDCPGALAVIRQWADDLGLPLVAGLKAGHERPNLPIVLGAKVTLTFESQKTAELTMPKPRFG